MECTQRLEFTQQLYETITERVCSEQIGFLGICGVKHPVKKGPNKIGRDPQTCSIVLNLNSVSRQHAVINVLNQREFMLMDLDSANKTKLMDKVLLPYVPEPLKDGDLVQFGDVFGVFRLLEENDDLPMTQAINIPETPVSTRHVKVTKVPITTVPESPDVSDRDDSFIMPSQTKAEKCFKNTNSHYIKPSSNMISIQPMGSSKIDNVYWSSSKHSISLNSQLDESNNKHDVLKDHVNGGIHEMETQNPFLNEQAINQRYDNIHDMETQGPFSNKNGPDKDNNCININDMETQLPYPNDKYLKHNNNMNKENNNINEMETQLPFVKEKSPKQNKYNIHEMETQAITSSQPNDSVDSIYTANTQIPKSPSLHSLATQLPQSSKEHLPEICKIDNQHEMHLDLFTINKDDNMLTADTQPYFPPQEVKEHHTDASNCSKVSVNLELDASKVVSNKSDDEIVLEEMDTEHFEDNFDSQPLLPIENLEQSNFDHERLIDKTDILITKNKKLTTEIYSDCSTGNNKIKTTEIHSDSSTDCEDVIISPNQKNKINQEDDDLTDCEDILEDIPKNKPEPKIAVTSVSNDDFEDMLTQKIDNNFEELSTQLIAEDFEDKVIDNNVEFEDMLTQVIDVGNISKDSTEPSICNQNDIESPFKIPFISPLKVKKKDIKLALTKEKLKTNKNIPIDNDENNYYEATQDILQDLCSQQVASAQNDINIKNKTDRKGNNESDDELVPCSVESYKTGSKFPYIEDKFKAHKSSDSTDEDDKDGILVAKMSIEEIREVIGIDAQVDKLRKQPSESSDIEITPKKVRSTKFMDVDLPNSQEIKTTVSRHCKAPVTESSSESEPENDSQEQCTPILFRKQRKPKKDAKIDLTKKFDVASLPTRVITRVRKPTTKLQDSEYVASKSAIEILKPKFIPDQEEEIDKDIIHENISRLKNKTEKSKQKDNKNNKKSNVKKKRGEEENLIRQQLTKENTEIKETKTTIVTNSLEGDKIINEKIKERDISGVCKSSMGAASKLKSDNDAPITNVKLSTETDDNSCKDTSANSITRSTRSTRSRRMVNMVKENSQNEDKTTQRKHKENKSIRRNQSNETPIVINLTEDTVTEIRRSKRQRTSKEKKEDKLQEKVEKVSKSILRKDKLVGHEQSTVYSLSSGSGTESPVNLKRPAVSDLDPPSTKRTRSNVTNNASMRSTPVRINRTQHVLFTAFPYEEVRVKLEKLGAVIVSDVSACTMVLTQQIKRTFKFLCAVGLGKPIVGPSWVQACADSNMIVDPWFYVLKDEAAEKRFQFNLERVLLSKRNFLKGYNVSSTPNVLPNAAEMRLIVESSGGLWKEGGSQWVCVSCMADKALWPTLKKRGATVVTAEFILGGVLRQKVDINSTKL
ncbi:hypothetical protein evm_011464 [Chilo suppressalis]|nr:hypothetical protein evm_011464 [Chilo suppressalis]